MQQSLKVLCTTRPPHWHPHAEHVQNGWCKLYAICRCILLSVNIEQGPLWFLHKIRSFIKYGINSRSFSSHDKARLMTGKCQSEVIQPYTAL